MNVRQIGGETDPYNLSHMTIDWQHINVWASSLKRDVIAVYLAARDKRTPWIARILALAVAAYALSPIDLIPDFIPVLGYLDDLILVPAGLWLVIRMVPEVVMVEARQRAIAMLEKPVSWITAIFIGLIWTLAALAFSLYFYQWCVG